MSGSETVSINADEDGMRLDRWFRERYPALGHGALQKLLRTGQVRVDGSRAKANQRIAQGQEVRVPPMAVHATDDKPKPPPPSASAADRKLIADLAIYEDEDLLILNKTPGLAVQGGSKMSRHIDGILAGMGQGEKRPRLVHRLDRETSGVLAIAKRRTIAASLGKAFQTRSVRKIYWAVTGGVPDPVQGEIDIDLIKAKGPKGDRVRAAHKGEADAQRAVTKYSVVDKVATTAAWVSLKPLTGRQHQLRAHMAAIGTPILGDDKYEGDALTPPVLENRLHLHARRLSFKHPRTGKIVDVTAPLPKHMVDTFAFFGFEVPASGAVDGDDEA
ncbi:RluA family pseudouridine synthase [Tepidamorphus sp. 3E244]|uniref:RluA family pseudouridine synthase n=1 Tax=Tepidamorphus sp. 3E244 TaxID=3385498 RepID=UPI0038FD361F